MTQCVLHAGPIEPPLDQSLHMDHALVSCQLVMMAGLKDANTNYLRRHDLPLIEEPLILMAS